MFEPVSCPESISVCFPQDDPLPVCGELCIYSTFPGSSESVGSRRTQVGFSQLVRVVVVVSFLPVLFWRCSFPPVLATLPLPLGGCHLSEVLCVCSLLFSSTRLVPLAYACREPDFNTSCQLCYLVLQLLWCFVLWNCCSADFWFWSNGIIRYLHVMNSFFLIQIIFSTENTSSFIVCLHMWFLFVLCYYITWIVSWAMHSCEGPSLSWQIYSFFSLTLCVKLFLLASSQIILIVFKCQCWIQSSHLSHQHEPLTWAFCFCDLPLITHCCSVTVWMKAVHCWLAIFLTD